MTGAQHEGVNAGDTWHASRDVMRDTGHAVGDSDLVCAIRMDRQATGYKLHRLGWRSGKGLRTERADALKTGEGAGKT
jgi:hypothetical protein